MHACARLYAEWRLRVAMLLSRSRAVFILEECITMRGSGQLVSAERKGRLFIGLCGCLVGMLGKGVSYVANNVQWCVNVV